jgi:uncharacterized protein YdaU (DUF1376 family)
MAGLLLCFRDGECDVSALPYIPLFVADYLADTSHLSTLEHGAYLLLIFNYWQRGKPLPSTDYHLARIARVTPREWAGLKPAIAPFFEENGEYWFHPRIEAELAKVRRTSKNCSRAGKASAEAKSKKVLNTRSTPVEQSFNHTETNTDTKEVGIGSAREAEVENVKRETPSDDLEAKLRDAAGWQSEPAPMLAVTGEVQALIDAGAILEIDVLPVVRALAPQCRSRTSWRYFLKAIVQARDDRIAAAKIVSLPQPKAQPHAKSSATDLIDQFLSR